MNREPPEPIEVGRRSTSLVIKLELCFDPPTLPRAPENTPLSLENGVIAERKGHYVL
jgi:hypothetical protein